MVLLQPMLVCSLVATPVPAAAAFIAGAAHPLLVALDEVAQVAASVPGASVTAFPSPFLAVAVAIACGAMVAVCLHQQPVRPACVALLAWGAIAWRPSLPQGSGMAELHMIDVGQGDAIALRSPHGHWVVFDAGRAWPGGDAGRSTVVPYIARRGGIADLFVLSHPHTDHVGGAASLIHALKPTRYLDAAFAAPNEAYATSLQAARAEHVTWARVHPGDSLAIDGMEITFLAPDSAWTVSLPDPNNASTVALVRIGDVRILLVGDAEAPEEAWLLAHAGANLHADILKVGHHGSSTSSTAPFLDAVAPRLALMSVGAGNTYGHPSVDVIRDLSAHHAQVLRTDLAGTIVVRTDGHRIMVAAEGTEWELPPAGAVTPSQAGWTSSRR
jgi:competence protein ComEC